MNSLLRRFVELIEVDLAAAGFVRRGPVFRLFDSAGDGIVLDIQRTTAMRGQVEFFVNVGVLLAAHLRHYFPDSDPRRDAMPHHSVWSHRLAGMTGAAPDHRFSLSTQTDADHAAAAVRAWLSENLPRMNSWLGDCEAMLAAIEADRQQSARARAEQLASGRWKAGSWPDGVWNESIVRVFAHAQRGEVDSVKAEIATWRDTGPGSLAADALAIAQQRLDQQQA